MHTWGEKDFDWKGLDEAIDLVTTILSYGRIRVSDAKEKWGTARIYCTFGWDMIHGIIWPRYAFKQYKSQRIWELDCSYGHYITTPLNFIAIPLQKKLYRLAYYTAILSFPHLRAEILDAADFPELLEGL